MIGKILYWIPVWLLPQGSKNETLRMLTAIAIIFLIAGCYLFLFIPKNWNLLGIALIVLGLSSSFFLGTWGLPLRATTKEEQKLIGKMYKAYAPTFPVVQRGYNRESITTLGVSTNDAVSDLDAESREAPFAQYINTLKKFVIYLTIFQNKREVQRDFNSIKLWAFYFERGLSRRDPYIINIAFGFLDAMVSRQFEKSEIIKNANDRQSKLDETISPRNVP